MHNIYDFQQQLVLIFITSLQREYGDETQDEAKCIAIEECIARLNYGIEIEEFVNERLEANMNKHMDKLKALKAQSVSAFSDFKREVRSSF